MRTLILSDIHGNLEALDAVLEAAGDVDAVWNLGDVVGYGASPNECVERVRTVANTHVRGNHDRVCSQAASADNFNPAAREAAAWTAQHLSEEATQWLAAVPAGPLERRAGRMDVALAHGSPMHEDVYILNIRDAWLPLEHMKQRATFFGHTHVQGGFGWQDGKWFQIAPAYPRVHAAGPVTWKLNLDSGRRYLINPGSVGQPRDHDPRAAYCILDDVQERVTFHRVPYDIDLAQGRILLAGLPERLAKRLREGR